MPVPIPYADDASQDQSQFGDALQQTLKRLSYLRSNPPDFSGNTGYPSAYPRPSAVPSGPSGTPPDYSSLLRFYGVSQPEIRQSPIFSNDFMTAHPSLGGALNNAFVAAAGTPEANGPEGVGGGISRALQGVLGVQPYMRQFQLKQQEAPLQYADSLAKLFGSTAQAQMYQAHANYFNQMPGERLESAQLRYLGQQQKLGQPVHDSTGKLLGYMGSDGFQSSSDLGIPDEASTAKPGATPRYNIESYTSALVNSEMSKRFGTDQTKWPSTPIDVWQGAINEAQNRFKVIPQDAINANRQNDTDTRWRATTQLSIQRMLEGEQGRINSRYDKTVNDPIIKWNDTNRLQAESNRKKELDDAAARAQQLQDTLLGPAPSSGSKKSKSKATPANANDPARPANVPDDYVFNIQGEKGAGWYRPTK